MQEIYFSDMKALNIVIGGITTDMLKSIKAYNALRKKEYPIYFSNYYEVYSAAKNLLQ